jgi:predicted lactoylglutathione lyase
MNKQIFLNLPVADLAKSKTFFQALGYPLNPQFTGEGAACVVISETISVMLSTHAKFREFTPKAVCDTTQAVEVLISLSCESREEVDTLVAKALAAGGSSYEKPEDFGFMYMHSFVDLDGHGWNLLHMSGQPPEQKT